MHDAGNQKGLRSGRIVVLSGILSDPLKLPPNFYKTRQTKPQVNVPVQNCMLQAIFLVPCVPCKQLWSCLDKFSTALGLWGTNIVLRSECAVMSFKVSKY